MQRLAYITGTWPAWSETFIQREVRLYCEAGVPVELIACRRGPAPAPIGCPEPYHLDDTPADSQAGSPPRALPLPGVVRRLASLRKHADSLQRLIEWCRLKQVQHLHGAFLDLPGLLTAAAARELGVPYSLSFHADDALQAKYDMGYLADEAEVLLGCNRRVCESLAERHPSIASRFHLIPHGLLLAEWPHRVELWQPSSPLQLLFVGRLVEKKQPGLALRVLRELQDRQPAELTMIGDGPLHERLVGEAEVTLLGHQPPERVRAAMQQADLLLVTSRDLPGGRQEGLPNVVLEAMATGLPVIAAPAGSLDELLSDQTGFPVSNHRPATLAEAICAACSDPAATRQRLTRARHAVENRYAASRLIEERLRLLRLRD